MNEYEVACKTALEARGYVVLRNGWPDFLVMNRDWTSGFGLELKRGSDSVKPEQKLMHTALARFGIPVHVAREDWHSLLKKRGTCVILPEDYQSLKAKVAEMDSRIAEVLRLRGEYENAIKTLNVICEEQIMQPIVTSGSLYDAAQENKRLIEGGCTGKDFERCVESGPEQARVQLVKDVNEALVKGEKQ